MGELHKAAIVARLFRPRPKHPHHRLLRNAP